MNSETLDFVEKHRNDDVRTLALQAGRYPGVDMRTAVTQIEGWQLARTKLPTWAAVDGLLYPPRISMEQCSSEAAARYKASLACGCMLADLTGGLGIDCSYMARNFEKAFYIERNEELCRIARHNFKRLGLEHIDIVNGNSEDVIADLPHCDLIFVDPARRDTVGNKVVALSDCEPDIAALESLLMEKCDKAIVKCSPMLDITAACHCLRHVSEVHIVAVNNECKELLLVLIPQAGADDSYSATIHCVNISKERTWHFSCRMGDDAPSAPCADTPGCYLYEPNAAIQKAGCRNALAIRYTLQPLHPNSRLYTSNTFVEDFPGRVFVVDAVCGFSKTELKTVLGDVRKANITIRNFPDTVQGLRKRLKIEDGGDVYLFATTLADSRKVIIRCHKHTCAN